MARCPTTVGSGLWTVDCGLWTVDCGLWTVDCGLWTVDRGLWTVDRGLWTVDRGLWTVDCGLWTVDCGLWTVDSPAAFLPNLGKALPFAVVIAEDLNDIALAQPTVQLGKKLAALFLGHAWLRCALESGR